MTNLLLSLPVLTPSILHNSYFGMTKASNHYKIKNVLSQSNSTLQLLTYIERRVCQLGGWKCKETEALIYYWYNWRAFMVPFENCLVTLDSRDTTFKRRNIETHSPIQWTTTTRTEDVSGVFIRMFGKLVISWQKRISTVYCQIACRDRIKLELIFTHSS